MSMKQWRQLEEVAKHQDAIQEEIDDLKAQVQELRSAIDGQRVILDSIAVEIAELREAEST